MTWKQAIRGMARRREFRRLLTTLYLWRTRNHPSNRRHPLDRAYGVDTGGHIPAFLLGSGAPQDAFITAYAGCVPSAVHAALSTIPDPDAAEFVDLGCGKGRALIVASTLQVRRIRGVLIDPALAEQARRNAAHVHRSHPGRPPIEIVLGDASSPDLGDGDVVLFFYHSFTRDLVKALVDHLANRARPEARMFLVYENPVYAALLDDDPRFTRWYADMLPYAPDEIGFGPDVTEGVAIWTNSSRSPAPSPHRIGEIVVKTEGWRAEIV